MEDVKVWLLNLERGSRAILTCFTSPKKAAQDEIMEQASCRARLQAKPSCERASLAYKPRVAVPVLFQGRNPLNPRNPAKSTWPQLEEKTHCLVTLRMTHADSFLRHARQTPATAPTLLKDRGNRHPYSRLRCKRPFTSRFLRDP